MPRLNEVYEQQKTLVKQASNAKNGSTISYLAPTYGQVQNSLIEKFRIANWASIKSELQFSGIFELGFFLNTQKVF